MKHFRIPLWRSAVVLIGLTIGSSPSHGQNSPRFEGSGSSVRSATSANLRPIADTVSHMPGRSSRYFNASEPSGQVSQEGRCAVCFSTETFPRREGRERLGDHASEIRHPSGIYNGKDIGSLGRWSGSHRGLGAPEAESTDALSSTGLFEAVDSFCRSLLRML